MNEVMNETVEQATEHVISKEQMDAAIKTATANQKTPITGSSIGEIIIVSGVTIGVEVGLYLLGSKVVVPKIKSFFKKKEAAAVEPEEEPVEEETED